MVSLLPNRIRNEEDELIGSKLYQPIHESAKIIKERTLKATKQPPWFLSSIKIPVRHQVYHMFPGPLEPPKWEPFDAVRNPTPADLGRFAMMTAKRLQEVYFFQMGTVVVILSVTLFLSALSIFMIFQSKTNFSALLGASAVGAFLVAKSKWQSFDQATIIIRVSACFESHGLAFMRVVEMIETMEEVEVKIKKYQDAVEHFNTGIKNCN